MLRRDVLHCAVVEGHGRTAQAEDAEPPCGCCPAQRAACSALHAVFCDGAQRRRGLCLADVAVCCTVLRCAMPCAAPCCAAQAVFWDEVEHDGETMRAHKWYLARVTAFDAATVGMRLCLCLA